MEYIDNLWLYEEHEAEQERLHRLRKRRAAEWGEEEEEEDDE